MVEVQPSKPEEIEFPSARYCDSLDPGVVERNVDIIDLAELELT